MIGYLTDAVTALVLTPLTADPTPADLRVSLIDPLALDETPLASQEVGIVAATTRIVGRERPVGIHLEHLLAVIVAVEHGDPLLAVTRRDAIVRSIVLGVEADPTLSGVTSPEGDESILDVSWSVDYDAGADRDTLLATATVLLTYRAVLDR